MTEFDNLREVDLKGNVNPTIVEVNGEGKWLRGWVREEPVPPLPTEVNTHILARNSRDETEGEYVLRLDAAGKRFWQFLSWGVGQTDGDLREQITGFEVLSEPCAVIAQAVVRAFASGRKSDDILREFGVK